MSFDLTNLFTNLGSIAGGINVANDYRGATLIARYNTLFSQYSAAGLYSSKIFDGFFLNIENAQNSSSTLLNQYQTLANNTLIGWVLNYQTQPNNSLSNAMEFVLAQMASQSASVTAITVGSSITYASNNLGNATVYVSTVDNFGKACENLYPETILATCNRDSQSGGVLGSESWLISGEKSVSNKLDWNWPGGSGASISITSVDSLATNLVQNSDFETWTSATACTNWIFSGAGVQQGATQKYKGTYSLEFTGNGSALQSAKQLFPSNTLTNISAYHYCFHYWLSTSGLGVLQISLQDQTGAITSDREGNQNSQSINLSGTGAWVTVKGSFATPAVNPSSGYQIVLETTSALSNGATLFLDSLALTRPSRLGNSGPYFSIFSGNSTTYLFDSATITTTSNAANTSWQRVWHRFGYGGAVLLPSSSTPTIPDSLIT